MDSIAAGLTLHDEAVRAWLMDEAPDSLVLADWPAGAMPGSTRFTVADFERYRLSIPGARGERSRLRTADDAEDRVREGAREALLAAHAIETGGRLNAKDEERIRQEWLDVTNRWAGALRMRPGQDAPNVKILAHAALSDSGQGIHIIREEILAMGRMFRSVYPVSVQRPGEGEAIEASP